MSQEIADNAKQSRYEIRVDGTVAGFAEYRLRAAAVVFTHAEIDPPFEGKGLGGALARGALDDVRVKGLSVVPLCPFIKGWIERHPEYQDLVTAA